MLNLTLFTRSDLQISSRHHTIFLEGLREHFNLSIIRSPGHNISVSKEEIEEKYKPDVVVCHAHSKYMNGYFKNFNCLKVMVAADFFKVISKKKEDFYKNNQFDIVFQRRYLDYDYLGIKELPIFGAKSVYLPWCADEEEFFPDFDNWFSRRKKIGVASCYHAPFYEERKKAIEILNKHDFIRNGLDKPLNMKESEYKVVNSDYPKFLRKYVSNLSSSEDGSMFGRVVESMASGCVILTPTFGCIEELFPRKGYILYKKDLSDIVGKAENMLDNLEETKFLAEQAYKDFREYHTNKLRIKEMADNINLFYEKGELERRWNQ